MNKAVMGEKPMTYTYTSPKGVIVVVAGVPTVVAELEEGPDEVMYEPSVSRKLNHIVRDQLKLNFAPGVYAVPFEEYEIATVLDAQIRIQGRKVNYGGANIQVWKEAIDKIYGTFDGLRKAFIHAQHVSRVSFPIIKTVGPGSLKFGLQAKASADLYRDLSTPEVRVMQLLFDGYSFVADRNAGVANELIQKHPEIAIAVAAAIERLSPDEKSSIKEVELIPNEQTIGRNRPLTLTTETYLKAKWKRESLQALLDGEETRWVEIIGQIYSLSRDGRLSIKQIEYNYPETHRRNTVATFDQDIFEEVASFFKDKKRVVFKGVERKVNKIWSSEPEINSVKEAPPLEELDT